MSDEPDYYLEIDGIDGEDEADSDSAGGSGRKWIGVRFECCGVYSRIYKNRRGDAYEGACPRCLRKIHVGIGEGGTDSRFFIAE